MMVLEEEGGLYGDLDFIIEEWDPKINHYFDFFGHANFELDKDEEFG